MKHILIGPTCVTLVFVLCLLTSVASAGNDVPTLPPNRFILDNAKLKGYVTRFNADDEELYANISNQDAYSFLDENVPLFECPDQDFERTYYFRWWTYHKHVKKTQDGYVITEFLPKVSWPGKHNTISCPAAHHYYEGPCLREEVNLTSFNSATGQLSAVASPDGSTKISASAEVCRPRRHLRKFASVVSRAGLSNRLHEDKPRTAGGLFHRRQFRATMIYIHVF